MTLICLSQRGGRPAEMRRIKKYASAMMMDGATVQGTYQIGRFMNHLCAMSSAANHVAFHQECIGISRLFAGSIALLICVAISFIGGLLGVGMLARMEYSMRKKGRYKKRYATYAAMCTCAGAVAQVVGVACYWSFAGVLSGSWMTEIDFVNTSPYNGCYFSWYGGVFACLQLTTAAAMTIWNLTEKSLLSFERPEEEDDDEDFWEPFRRQQQGKKDRNREEDRGPHRQLAQNQGEPSLILPPRAPSAFVPPRMGR
uniref:Uncharacterized protein n=1 Tax=Chromera velia CCMP2878 TaxID=1169474 RepID=A0A0G4I223_9ALVE|eukprot:Cvel_10286.t1-p1 / transcript=Cvel_10286.t1 / gene=Cvel_10286 / organism=Chromera_velia_CCMP2878 / gene_product=hypothetical protein / transcript_product=hypothetical protein / location=Cvel_scaffold617:45104-64023(+) / protein_length=255 / sequence_SO=supercontig / SO=protein_coding / is_pseudo=false